MSLLIGYFGKIPARGDFLRHLLPDATVALLDGWVARNLGAQQQRHGAGFDLVWEQAPIWRFSLDAGRLDQVLAASGIWMPSIDRAGRCFPLLLVVLHPGGSGAEPVLDALQPAMQELVQWDLPPERLEAAIELAADRPLGGRVPGDLWYRPALHDGSPVLLRAALPDGDGFELLLHPSPQERAAMDVSGNSG